MTVTAGKYRLGAPSSILLDFNSATQTDLGSSVGGVTFSYKPTYFHVVADQTISPTQAWRTMEEGTVEFSMPELSAQKLMTAFSYDPTTVTTTTAGTMGAFSPAPTTVINGTPAAGTYTYKVFAYTSNGDGIPVGATGITTGPTTLSSVNSITINWTVQTGSVVGYGVERFAGGVTQGLLARVGPTVTTFTDTGIVATPYVDSVAQPTYPSTDTLLVGSTVGVQTHQLDIVIPKNVIGAAGLSWRWTFWKVYSDGQPQIDWKRDKNSEYKIQLSLLGDATRAQGQQLFRAQEEYSALG